jgi:hypothetical protein
MNITIKAMMVAVCLILIYRTLIGLNFSSDYNLDDGVVSKKQKATATATTKTIEKKKKKKKKKRGEYANYRNDIKIIPKIETLLAKVKSSELEATPIPECLATTPATRALPTPVVLMSRGRSGSSVLWQVLSKITGAPPAFHKSKEFVGQNNDEQLDFFDTNTKKSEKIGVIKHIDSEQNLTLVPAGGEWQTHGEWLVNYMCAKRTEFASQADTTEAIRVPNTEGGFSLSSSIVGLKWKPFWNPLLTRNETIETLKRIASMAMNANTEATKRPPILIVRSRRNPIDHALSRYKHKHATEHIQPHCAVGDKECLEKHNTGQPLNIKNPNYLCRSMLETWYTENLFDELLKIVTAPSSLPVYKSVSYDALFYPESDAAGEEAWNELVQFVSPHTPPLSWKTIQESATMAATTTTRKHVDKIANWNEVYQCLQGTPLEPFFRLDDR